MDPRKKIELILNDWYHFAFPPFITREFPPAFLQESKILCLIGPRRAGKTYYLFQLLQALQKSGVSRDNLLYLNFEDERLYPLEGEELSLILPVYYEHFKIDPSRPLYLFFDELQAIPFWDKWIRRLYDTEPQIKIILSGSTSQLLSQEISTSLAGRTLSFKVLPFSYAEYLRYQNVDLDLAHLTEKQIALLQQKLEEYLLSGGFPEVFHASQPAMLLREYFNSIFYHDIIGRYGVNNVRLLSILLNRLLNYASKKISFSKVALELKDLGYKVGKATLIDYAHYAEQVFFIFSCPIFSLKIKEINRYPTKVYCVDTGLVHALTFKFREEIWTLYENLVFLELYRRNREIYYWKNAASEVDFIIKDGIRIVQAIQVSYTLTNKSTRDREIMGLVNAMAEFHLSKGLILTKNEDSTEIHDGKTIHIIPFYKWLLTDWEEGTN